MEFLLVASAHFLALLSPGPDFFLIMQASLRPPLRYAIAVCAGITLANAVYLFCAVLGLEIVREMEWLMTLLKYLGAIYLVFLGIMLLRSPLQSLNHKGNANILQVRHLGKQFLIGFMSGIFNPKNAIFYLSLFTVMVADDTGLETRCFYALWMTVIVFFWDIGVAILFGRDQVRAWLGRAVFWVEKFSGGMLVLFGLLLSFS